MEMNAFTVLLIILGALDVALAPILLRLWWGEHVSR